jgi:hypothetical protein
MGMSIPTGMSQRIRMSMGIPTGARKASGMGAEQK